MSQVDAVTIEVINNYLQSAAREMNRNLIRTSYSTIIYEVHDFGLGIYDRHCRMLAEAPGIALFTRGNDYALKKMIEHLGYDNIHPGDLILLNYPYWSSAHVLDVLAASPIFAGDDLVGFTAVKVHWLDLGQKDPGYVLDSTDMYQEGLVMPCLKIYEKGVRNKAVEDLIRFNSRMASHVLGDMNAQVSSCRTGEKRIAELVEKFGLETFETAVEAILDHGERLARARLAKLPKGTWSAEDWVDDDGINKDDLVKLKATVTITDDEMIVDWTGSSPAVEGPLNLPIGLTVGLCGLIFKGITTPDTPANEGNFRPLKVIAPKGEVMHAEPPAPTFALWIALLAPEVITKALAQAMPDTIPACSGGDVFTVMGVGTHPETGAMWVEATNECVGFGAHAGADGENGIMHMTQPGSRNNPVEVLETKAPWIIENYCLRQDSGGPGLHRGGLGITRTYKFLTDASVLTLVKKTKTRPWGMEGGETGENGHVILWPETERETFTGMIYETMKPGDRLVNNSGGGGGWGDPLQRDPAAVLRDVKNDYISSESARDHYGVVISPETGRVDEAATLALRAELLPALERQTT